MARVFVSYRRVAPDDAVAVKLYRVLTDLGHDVFVDSETIKIGDRWPSEIGASLELAEWFVPLISSSYLASENCVDKELVIALSRRRSADLKILPVHLAWAGKFPELVREVAEIQADRWGSPEDTLAVVERVAAQLPRPTSLVKGMRPFDVVDGDAFRQLCREREIEECRRLLAETRGTLVIHGVSGSGKTSFVRAGLIAGMPAGGWQLVTAGDDVPAPSESLAGSATTLILDQFEQAVVQLAADPAAAGAFEDAAAAWLAGSPDRRLVIVLRDEYRTPFDAVLPKLSGGATSFPLLPLTPDDAGRALVEILKSAKVEHDVDFVKKLVHELVDGVPPRVRPALLQLIAHESWVSERGLDKRHWGETPASRRAFFETHVRSAVLDRMPRPVRLASAFALRGLTAGELKTAPRTAAFVAKEEHLAEDLVVRTLEAAASPDARVVTVEEDAGVETYQLVHDLFAGAIHGVVKAEELARRGRTRRVVGALLLSLVAASVVLAVVAVVLWRGSEESRAEAERNAAEVQRGADERFLGDALELLDGDPAGAATKLASVKDLDRHSGLPLALARELAVRGVPVALPGSRLPVIGVAMDTTGDRVLAFHASTSSGEIHVWDLREGRAIRSWAGSRIVSFASTPDASRVVAGTDSGKVVIIDVDGRAILLDTGLVARIAAVAITDDGKTLAYAAHRHETLDFGEQLLRRVVVCDIETRRCHALPPARVEPNQLRFDDAGGYLAAVEPVGLLHVWRLGSGAPKHLGAIRLREPDGSFGIIGRGPLLDFTRVEPLEIIIAFEGCSLDEITLVDDKPQLRCVSRRFSGDADRLIVDPAGAYAFCAAGSEAGLTALATGEVERPYRAGWATSNAGLDVIVHRKGRDMKVIERRTGEIRRHLRLAGGELHPVVSANGQRLAVGATDGTVRVWSLVADEVPTSADATRSWLRGVSRAPQPISITDAAMKPDLETWPIDVAATDPETDEPGGGVLRGSEIGSFGTLRAERIATWSADVSADLGISRALRVIDSELEQCLSELSKEDRPPTPGSLVVEVGVRDRRIEYAKSSSEPPVRDCIDAAFASTTFLTFDPSFDFSATYRLWIAPLSGPFGGLGGNDPPREEPDPAGSGFGLGIGTGCPGSRRGYGAGN